jgi:hypothetical protein
MSDLLWQWQKKTTIGSGKKKTTIGSGKKNNYWQWQKNNYWQWLFQPCQ